MMFGGYHMKKRKENCGALKKQKTHHNGQSTFLNVLGTMDKNIPLYRAI